MKRLVEIRSYKLKPGAAAAFHQAALKAMPLLQGKMDVVAHGASPHEADAYFLIRAYADLAERNAQLVWMSQESIEDLRRLNAGT